MNILLDELCIYVCNFLEIKDIHTLEYVNVKYNTLINKFVYLNEKNKESLLVQLIPYSEYISDDIFDIFGGIKNYYQLPKISNFNYRDYRDYIDYIKYNDVNYPITIGIDNHNRNFICFRIKKDMYKIATDITVVLTKIYK